MRSKNSIATAKLKKGGMLWEGNSSCVGRMGHTNPSESLTVPYPAGVMAIQDGQI